MKGETIKFRPPYVISISLLEHQRKSIAFSPKSKYKNLLVSELHTQNQHHYFPNINKRGKDGKEIPTWSTLSWSSGVASAPLSSWAMASRSSCFRVLASFPFFKKAGKKEIPALHFLESEGVRSSAESLKVLWFVGLVNGKYWELRSVGNEGLDDWMEVRSEDGEWRDKAMEVVGLSGCSLWFGHCNRQFPYLLFSCLWCFISRSI